MSLAELTIKMQSFVNINYNIWLRELLQLFYLLPRVYKLQIYDTRCPDKREIQKTT